MDLFRFIFPKK